MRPVDQTMFGPRDGNCFSACVASILELPIDGIPTFAHSGSAWLAHFHRWLHDLGLAASMYIPAIGDPIPPGFSIAGGPSRRVTDQLHACVAFDGSIVHDPHPSRDGLRDGVLGYVAIHGPQRELMWFNQAST